MSATVLILVLSAVFLASLLVNAVVVWLAGKLLRMPKATFARALAVVILMAVVQLLLIAGVFRLLASLPDSSLLNNHPIASALVLALGLILLQLVVQAVLVGLLLRASPGRSLAVAGIWLIIGCVYGGGLLLFLRAAVAEAFVVPTGGMATTVYGYQKIIQCPQCDYKFPVNCSQEVDPPEDDRSVILGCTCPNCRLHIELAKCATVEERDPRTGQMLVREVAKPVKPEYADYNTGDRILVAKSFFGLGSQARSRLDVVVFEYPVTAGTARGSLNYVKRVIGLPGETVGLSYGKIYILGPDRGLRFDDSKVPEAQRWQYDHMHVGDPSTLPRWNRGEFEILRKPPEVVLAMRRLVHDNDHPARDLKDSPRWVEPGGAKAWTADDASHTFKHAAADDARPAWLRYRHLIAREGRNKPELITDFTGYNSYEPQFGPRTQRWVGDLMLECDVTIDKPQGQTVLELSRGVDRFRAVFDLTTGACTFKRIKDHKAAAAPDDDAGEVLATKPTDMSKSGRHHLRFANVDDRLLLWVDDSLPFGDGVRYTPAEQKGPYANDLEPASIGVRGGAVTVGKLQLWRNNYFTQMGPLGNEDYPQVDDLSDSVKWDELRQLKPRTFYVQPGHYFVLGDNSPASSDSRAWGLVPERLVRGRAVLAYYPFNRVAELR